MSCHRLLLVVVIAVIGNTQLSSNQVAHAEDGVPPNNSTAAIVDAPPNHLRLVLPPTIYGVAGQEMNVYFDNICLALNPANYAFDVECSLGRQQQERWTLLPAETQTGLFPIKIIVRDQANVIVAEASSQLHIVRADQGAGKPVSLLCIGDSLTHASVYPEHIWKLCQNPGNPQLTLVGSHWITPTPGPVRHEGYGGWTAERFATHFTETARTGEARLRGSPFLYQQPDGTRQLNFRQYCEDVNGGAFPDRVTLFLGPNDIFSYRDDTIEAGIDKMLGYFDQLVTMIRKESPATRIGIMLPAPPAATQDAFGANYASGQTRWQYKRNQHRLVERMLVAHVRRNDPLVDLVPTVVNLDCRQNYPVSVQPANTRTTETIVRLNDGVHPAASGYYQIGDSVYAWLKATMVDK